MRATGSVDRARVGGGDVWRTYDGGDYMYVYDIYSDGDVWRTYDCGDGGVLHPVRSDDAPLGPPRLEH